MDLISIRRKYKNIRNIIITIFLITVLLVVIIGIKEIYINSKYDKIFKSYSEQYDIALSKQSEMIAQAQIEKRKEKNPQLTEEGKNNMASLYHSENKRVFLTFDDGPSETVTIPILETLKNEGIKATFFVLGSRVELYPELVKKEYDEGHYIASHGYSHEYSKIYQSSGRGCISPLANFSEIMCFISLSSAKEENTEDFSLYGSAQDFGTAQAGTLFSGDFTMECSYSLKCS